MVELYQRAALGGPEQQEAAMPTLEIRLESNKGGEWVRQDLAFAGLEMSDDDEPVLHPVNAEHVDYATKFVAVFEDASPELIASARAARLDVEVTE
jgi:hypothetical protein